MRKHGKETIGKPLACASMLRSQSVGFYRPPEGRYLKMTFFEEVIFTYMNIPRSSKKVGIRTSDLNKKG